jgi:hypothetical protein
MELSRRADHDERRHLIKGPAMKNREIYQNDPLTRKLANEGVANVNDQATDAALRVLRSELESFVCDGQYEKGLCHVLETFLANVNQAQQPAVWVSGFFGSGKSHLVKMLRALWVDTRFPDGATARGVARLPSAASDLLRELSTQGKRHGGLFAASGTLGASSRDKSVRLALLAVIFRAAGLPESFPRARLFLWMRNEGILDAVKQHLERNGLNLQEEVENLYVAEGLHKALVEIRPALFASQEACVATLNNQYPETRDVSNDEMLKATRQALVREGKLPLTVLVLDEVQQFIGDDPRRANDVQEAVEACAKNFASKLLFVGTGQTAVTGTPQLKKLEGRFTVRVELSDADVEAVIRQVVLAKKPEAAQPIEQTMQANLGEISRHLAQTAIGHRQEDIPAFVPDYPVLPVRRRFWENTLRVLDKTGTESQLRNQLSMIHKAIQGNLDEPLGSVLPADFLYFDSAVRLLQSRILPRKVHDKTMRWYGGSEDERLMARACGLVFLINKVADENRDLGLKASVDTLADLLVVDLKEGSTTLRARLPKVLDRCELLMKVGEEFRIQTEESAAWNDEFLSQRAALANDSARVAVERTKWLRDHFAKSVGKLQIFQGVGKVARTLQVTFESQLPADTGKEVWIWVRDGWISDEGTVRADARQTGATSATIFVFVPRQAADELRSQLMDAVAAAATLDHRGVPSSPEGVEARAAMETTRKAAEAQIAKLLSDSFSSSRVFQGGGTEIQGMALREMVLDAADNSLKRLYPQFGIADHDGWGKAYLKAQKGAPDALKAVGYNGEAVENPVCKAILGAIGAGKTGSEIRIRFESAPYGWPDDAIDGGLQVLLVAGAAKALDERKKQVAAVDLERKAIGKSTFKVESTTITVPQRLQVRKLFQKLGVQSAKPEEDVVMAPLFLDKLFAAAEAAGGDPPRPPRPDTAGLKDLRQVQGNELLLMLYNRHAELSDAIDQWTRTGQAIESRWPHWLMLEKLATHANGLANAAPLMAQAKTVQAQCLLLKDPDPMAPLAASLAQILREQLNDLKKRWDLQWSTRESRLEKDASWQALEPEQKHELRLPHGLLEAVAPRIDVESTEAVIATLDTSPLPALRDRIAAMPSRYDELLLAAAQLLEPMAKKVDLPSRTLKSDKDVDEWVDEARGILKAAIKDGPVIL